MAAPAVQHLRDHAVMSLLLCSGPGVFTEVFSHFSTLCQGITGSAGALVPGLYVVAVGLKVLDQIVVTNATADVKASPGCLRIGVA